MSLCYNHKAIILLIDIYSKKKFNMYMILSDFDYLLYYKTSNNRDPSSLSHLFDSPNFG